MKESAENQPGIEAWESCSEGELQSLGQSLRVAEKKRQTAKRTRMGLLASAAAILLALNLGVYSNKELPVRINCRECHELFDAYEQHLTEKNSMNSSEADLMAQHLDTCRFCRGDFEEAYPGVYQSITVAAYGGLSLISLLALRTDYTK